MKPSDMTGLEIAVIGYSGRFNNCRNAEEYWSRLSTGEEMLHVFDEDELRRLGISEEIFKKDNYVNIKGQLQEKECFDSAFFGYTPAEANIMDPQIRAFHEIVWEGLEMAGYAPGRTKLKVGLYGCASNNSIWLSMMSLDPNNKAGAMATSYLADKDHLCSLISYKLNLKGPAVLSQTACSSSLVAVHLAGRALLTGDCQIAVAGGISSTLVNNGGYEYHDNLILSPDGHCRAFDAEAKGTNSGEGGGVVILKKYQDALRDHDTIYAIIKGTAINNDGNDKMGYSAPSVEGQKKVIQNAIRIANVDANSISYIETHGTGTRLGDPVEFNALQSAYNQQKNQKTAIGSVKTNIGHLDTAAGIASLIKVILMLKYKKIPANINFSQPNPNIDFTNSSFYVNEKFTTWQSTSERLRAGISSFGIGGTNCHIIVEEQLPIEKIIAQPNVVYTINLSAKSEKKLKELCLNMAEFLKRNGSISLSDLAYTLNCGRTDFNVRKSISADSIESLISKLTNGADDNIVHAKDKIFDEEAVVFIFSGQGSQYINMGKDLYDNYSFFRDQMNECFALVKKHHNILLEKELFVGKEKNKDIKINQTLYAQLSLFSIGYSLAQFLIESGIKPAALIGHSIGEYTGAVISGVLTLDEATRIVGTRALLMQRVKEGDMYAVFTSEQTLKKILPNDVSIAAVNAEDLVVISGEISSTKRFIGILEVEGIEYKKLHTSHAFHSSMMDNILAEYTSFLKGFSFKEPAIPLISNVSGNFFENKITATYWSSHLRQTVRFGDGIDTLLSSGYNAFIEVGPGDQLISLIKRIDHHTKKIKAINTLRRPNELENDNDYLINRLSELWHFGKSVNWEKLYEDHHPHRIALPTYPFERTRFPFKVNLSDLVRHLSGASLETISKEDVQNWLYTTTWKKRQLHSQSHRNSAKNQILVFCDQTGYAEAIIKSLSNESTSFIQVNIGHAYTKKSSVSYSINFQEADDYARLINDLKGEGIAVTGIMHCWGLDQWPVSAERLNDALWRGYLSLTHLVKSLAGHGYDQAIDFNVIVNEATKVQKGEVINPLKAICLGALKVISVEHENLRCKLIDISGNDFTIADFIDALENEVFTDDRRITVSYRGNERYVEAINKIQNASEITPLRRNGCYLITGGFGGMGLSIAYDIAVKEKAKLALVSRREFPPKAEWGTWLSTHELNDATSKIILKIREMEEHGAEVALLCADVSDSRQLNNAIAQTCQKFGKINGLIWTAGMVDYEGVIQRRTTEQLITNLKCKVHGLLTASQSLDFAGLDFVILFSSVGNLYYKEKFGQVAYNAANEFLAAYAQQFSEHFKIATINWCDWKNVGMTIEAIQKKHRLVNKKDISIQEINASLSEAITPEEGVRVFRKCLGNPGSNFFIGKTDLIKNFDFEEYENNVGGHAEESSDISAISSFARPELSATYKEPEEALEIMLVALCCKIFGINKIGVNDDFFELGGDSLKAIQLINQIQKDLLVKVSLKEFFNNPTIAALARVIGSRKEELQSEQIWKSPAISRYYPLLPAQKRILILHKFHPDQTTYNQKFIFETDGIGIEKLNLALRQLIQRHVILRVSFDVTGNNPQQIVHERANVDVEQYMVKNSQELDSVLRQFERPFDLSTVPLFRLAVVKNETGRDYMVTDIHHIISDGISNQIFLNDLIRLYHDEILEPLPSDYISYVEYFYSQEVQEDLEKEKKYWLNRFADYVPGKGLIPDFPRSSKDSKEGLKHTFEISSNVSQRLNERAKKEGITLFTFNLAVLYILLKKLTNESDIVIGTTHMGRDLADFENVMGMFIETIALRNKIDNELTFKDFLGSVKDNLYKDFDNRKFPFEDLVNNLDLPKHENKNPLFDIVFSSDNISSRSGVSSQKNLKMQFKRIESEEEKVRFDLLFTFNFEDDRLSFSVIYNANLFRKETIISYGKYYEHILRQVVEDDEIKINEILLIKEEEQKNIINSIHKESKIELFDSDHVFSLISRTAAENEMDAVLVDGLKKTSYAQLIMDVDKLACYMRYKCAIKPGDKVAIHISRSDYLITAILATMKVRAVFVPIDISYPEQRIKFILDSSEADIVLTDSDLMFSIPFFKGTIFAMDVQMETLEKGDDFSFTGKLSDLAYILYTSGSTGTPKGVKISHKSLSNYLLWLNKYYFDNNKGYSMPLFTSISFDFTLTSIFSPLTRGDSIHIYGDNISVDQCLKSIVNSGVKAIKITPSHIDLLAALNLDSTTIQVAIVGGEELLPRHVSILKRLNKEIFIYNEYGPTEATIACSAGRIASDEEITIGCSINNTTIFILDENLNILPPNVPGEIFISGTCLANGYMEVEGTKEKFLTLPLDKNIRVYKSGDKGMYTMQNELLFLGRTQQNELVKIRGNRIELKEIESVFAAFEEVDSVIVSVKKFNGENILVAYYLSKTEIDESGIKSHLSKYLPKPMIPEIIMRLHELPITVNGKIDHEALPDPEISIKDSAHRSPLTEIEITLVRIWADVLNLDMDKIGLNSRFFSLGGNSLKIVQLSQKIEDEFKRSVPVNELFDYDTINSFIAYFFQSKQESNPVEDDVKQKISEAV